MGSPEIEGMETATNLNNARTSAQGNIYNVLASRASGAPIQTFNPSSVATVANAGAASARAGGINALGASGNLNASAGNLIGNTRLPDYTQGGLSSLFSGISDVLGVMNTGSSKAKRQSGGGTGWTDVYGGAS